jgi:hypothetical protein
VRVFSVVAVLSALGLLSGAASAAIVVLPNQSSTVTFTANVSEQCDVNTLPSAVSFNVVDHTAATNSSSETVTINNILLQNGKGLKISLEANAANFTPPTGGTVTWAASDVSWNAATWTNGTGAAGTLSNTAFNSLVTSAANAATLSTTGLIFTLAGKDTVDRAGNHTLVATWKLESL